MRRLQQFLLSHLLLGRGVAHPRFWRDLMLSAWRFLVRSACRLTVGRWGLRQKGDWTPMECEVLPTTGEIEERFWCIVRLSRRGCSHCRKKLPKVFESNQRTDRDFSWSCPFCRSRYRRVLLLKDHLEALSSPRPDVFPCPECGAPALKRLVVAAFGNSASNGDSEILFDGVVHFEGPEVLFVEDSALTCPHNEAAELE